MAVRKGQVFVMAAVILSSLLILTAISFQQASIDRSGTEYQFYFQNALNQQSVALNHGIKGGYNTSEMVRELYRFNGFIETRSIEKQVDYSALQFVILPEKQRALLVNYRPESVDYSFKNESWNNGTVRPTQHKIFKFSRDREDFQVVIEELGVNEDISAYNPTLIGYIQMDAEDELWRNHIIR